ncbi:MAG: hypothetical protein CM15mP74_36180 [Halieaceae bacterium]|nr:MAG: hypothetical protein CM15mP74_36180 [Halieaceae bacterium]
MVLASHCEGGVAAAVGQCTDPGSDREVLAAVTDRDDFTGNLEPRHGRAHRQVVGKAPAAEADQRD